MQTRSVSALEGSLILRSGQPFMIGSGDYARLPREEPISILKLKAAFSIKYGRRASKEKNNALGDAVRDFFLNIYFLIGLCKIMRTVIITVMITD